VNLVDARAALLGAAAGAVGGIVQPAVGKLEELFLPPGEDSNVARHYVETLARRTGLRPRPGMSLAGATVFHIGYALFWGAAYGVVCQRTRCSPAVGAAGLASVLYLAAFSRVGAATLAGSEPPPTRRPRRTWALTTTLPLAYGVTTAWVFERLRRRVGDGAR
jgi:hypothetical protein